MKKLLGVTAAWMAWLNGCTHQPEAVDRGKVIGAIQKEEEAQETALGSKDLDAAVAVFAQDATLYVPGMPPAVGREAIKLLNERSLQDPALNAVIDEGSRKWWVAESGELATTTYRYSWTHTDRSSGKPITDQVVSQTTWKRVAGGAWKNVSDINSIYPRL